VALVDKYQQQECQERLTLLCNHTPLATASQRCAVEPECTAARLTT